jgi:hypothetical protein
MEVVEPRILEEDSDLRYQNPLIAPHEDGITVANCDPKDLQRVSEDLVAFCGENTLSDDVLEIFVKFHLSRVQRDAAAALNAAVIALINGKSRRLQVLGYSIAFGFGFSVVQSESQASVARKLEVNRKYFNEAVKQVSRAFGQEVSVCLQQQKKKPSKPCHPNSRHQT